jgi:type IV secretion system protein VirB6
MPFGVFQAISTLIVDYGTRFTTVSSAFVTAVTPIIQSGLALQITLHGFRIIRGEGGQQHLLDMFSRCLRAFLVFSTVLAAGAYETYMHQFIVGLGNDVLVGFGGDPALNKYQQIDATMQRGFDAFALILDWGNDHIDIGFIYIDLTGLWAILAGALLILLILMLGAFACFELLVIDFGLLIFFGIGPLFVACYAFEATARYFESWLAGVLKWLFAGVVISITVLMAVWVLERFVLDISKGGNLDQVLLAILTAGATTGLLIMIVRRAPEIAADLVGGGALGSAAREIKSQISQMIKGSRGDKKNGAGGGGTGVGGAGAGGHARRSGMGPGAAAVSAARGNGRR